VSEDLNCSFGVVSIVEDGVIVVVGLTVVFSVIVESFCEIMVAVT
jgi:hypothetical protein